MSKNAFFLQYQYLNRPSAHFGFNIIDNIGHFLTECIEFFTVEYIIFSPLIITIYNRPEAAGEVNPFATGSLS